MSAAAEGSRYFRDLSIAEIYAKSFGLIARSDVAAISAISRSRKFRALWEALEEARGSRYFRDLSIAEIETNRRNRLALAGSRYFRDLSIAEIAEHRKSWE